jgi:hypothetical protein
MDVMHLIMVISINCLTLHIGTWGMDDQGHRLDEHNTWQAPSEHGDDGGSQAQFEDGYMEWLFYPDTLEEVNAEDGARKMETDNIRANLGATFYQCRAAREAKHPETTFDLTTGQKVTSNFVRIGSMDRVGDDTVQKTFHGARVNKFVKELARRSIKESHPVTTQQH